MIDLKELKEIALANVSDPTTEYFYRYMCRWYSKTFHTPLHVVFTLPPQEIALAYFEEGYEAMDEEDRFEDMMKAIDPDFDNKEEESIQDFIEMIEEEEQNKRLAKAEKEAQLKPKVNQNNREQQSLPVVRKFEDEASEEDGNGLDDIDDIKKL